MRHLDKWQSSRESYKGAVIISTCRTKRERKLLILHNDLGTYKATLKLIALFELPPPFKCLFSLYYHSEGIANIIILCQCEQNVVIRCIFRNLFIAQGSVKMISANIMIASNECPCILIACIKWVLFRLQKVCLQWCDVISRATRALTC